MIPIMPTISSTCLGETSLHREQVQIAGVKRSEHRHTRRGLEPELSSCLSGWSGGLGWRWKHAEDHGDSRWREAAKTPVEFTGTQSKTFGVATRALELSLKYFCQKKTKKSHTFNLKMSFAMIEWILPQGNWYFWYILFKVPPGSITNWWQSLCVLIRYKTCAVCVRAEEPGTTPARTLTTLILIPQKMMPYKLHLVFGIFSYAGMCVCVCVILLSAGVTAMQECAFQCVFLPCRLLAVVVPRHQPFVLPQTGRLGQPGLRYLH